MRPPGYGVMVLAALLPLGGHYAKHLIGPLKPFFMADAGLHLTNTQFGALLSASDWAMVAAPVVAGMAVDVIGAHLAAILFTALSLVGHIIFVVGVAEHSFVDSLLGRCLYGIGEAAMSISQGGIICHTFTRDSLTLSLGLSESARAFGNWLGKVLPASLATLSGTYIAALWAGVVFLLVSQMISLGLFIEHSHNAEEKRRSSGLVEILSRGLKPRRLCSFPLQFWLLTAVHVLLNNVHNLFSGISTDYIRGRSKVSVQTAAFISSADSVAPIFLCSAVSLVVSQRGGRLYWCMFASACNAAAFVLMLLFPSLPMVPCMVLLSVNAVITPALLRSAIPMLIHPDMYGLGFGLYAGLTGLGGNANMLVGWLRDSSGTYDTGLYFLLFLSVLAAALCVVTNSLDARQHGCLNLSKDELQSWDAAAAAGHLQAELAKDKSVVAYGPEDPPSPDRLPSFHGLPPAARREVVDCAAAAL